MSLTLDFQHGILNLADQCTCSGPDPTSVSSEVVPFLVVTHSIYRYGSYQPLECAGKHPGRLGLQTAIQDFTDSRDG